MKNRFSNFKDSKLTQISIYTVITIVASFILIHFVQHIDIVFEAIGRGLHWLGVIFVPMAWGFALAYLLYPLAGAIEKRLARLPHYRKKGRRARPVAVAITMTLLVIIIIAVLSIVISAVSREVKVVRASDFTDFLNTLATNIRTFFDAFSRWLNSLNISSDDLSNALDKISSMGSDYAKQLTSHIFSAVSSIPSILANILFAIIFGIYFLLDARGLMSYWDKVLKAFSRPSAYRKTHILINDCDRVFSGYIRGQLIDATIMTFIVGVSLSVLNVRFAMIIGIMTGIGNLIPYFGPFVAYVSTALVCIVNGDIKKLIIAIIVLFIVQTIDGNIINPKLLSQNISVHPMLVIAALIIGSAIGGIVGMLLAVPVAAILKIQFDRLIDYLTKRREKQLSADDTEGATDAEHKL